MELWLDAFQLPVDLYLYWMMRRKSRRKARYRRKLERMKTRLCKDGGETWEHCMNSK